jgi:hypothetical protein
MSDQESDGATRLASILGVRWRRRRRFAELTLAVGRRLHLDDVVVVEWTYDYGDDANAGT